MKFSVNSFEYDLGDSKFNWSWADLIITYLLNGLVRKLAMYAIKLPSAQLGKEI